MDKFDFVKYLLEETIKERDCLIHKRKCSEAYRSCDEDDVEKCSNLRKEWLDAGSPSVCKIRNDLRMIRRLTLEIEKEL